MELLFPALLTALVGLLGVLTGAIITSVTSYILESKRGARDRQREERTRLGAVRLAARIVYGELADSLSCAQLRCSKSLGPKDYVGS